MKVLVTGFEPFGGETVNPALEGVQRLEDKILGAEIVKLQLPTVFGKSKEVLERALEKENPDIVICVGQAGGRDKISIERLAINIDDAGIPDNEKNKPVDEPIVKNGPSAYFSSLPIKEILKNLKENKIPGEISNSAGTYVCNHIMYSLLHCIEEKGLDILGGFIHIPYIPDQVLDKNMAPSMSLDYIVKGLTIAIETSIKKVI